MSSAELLIVCVLSCWFVFSGLVLFVEWPRYCMPAHSAYEFSCIVGILVAMANKVGSS